MPRDFFESGKSYNVSDLRLEKTVNGVNTEYYYNGSILIAMADGTNTQKFSYDSTGNAVSVNFNGTEYYYLRNAQGDIVKLIDKNKNAVVEYTYDSWGKLLSVTGTLATTLGTNQPFRYRGYVYDNETGWYYLQSRYYDPTTCRFISADVLLSTGQGVIGHNSFAYCGNNPIIRADESGYSWWDFLVFGTLVHKAITDYLTENRVCGVNWYPCVAVTKNRYGKGDIGFVDVVDQAGGAYEIKSVASMATAFPQLNHYISAQLKGNNKSYPFKSLEVGKLSFNGQVTVQGKIVEFVCAGNGVILYEVVNNDRKEPVPNIAYVPAPNLAYSPSRKVAPSGTKPAMGIGGSILVGLGLGIAMGGGIGRNVFSVNYR